MPNTFHEFVRPLTEAERAIISRLIEHRRAELQERTERLAALEREKQTSVAVPLPIRTRWLVWLGSHLGSVGFVFGCIVVALLVFFQDGVMSLNPFLITIILLGGLALMLVVTGITVEGCLRLLFSAVTELRKLWTALVARAGGSRRSIPVETTPAAAMFDSDPVVVALRQALASQNVFVQHVQSDRVLKHVFDDDRPGSNYRSEGWGYDAGVAGSYWIDVPATSHYDMHRRYPLWNHEISGWNGELWPNSEFECVFAAASRDERHDKILLWIHQLGQKQELNAEYRLSWIGGNAHAVNRPAFTCMDESYEQVTEEFQRAGYEGL